MYRDLWHQLNGAGIKITNKIHLFLLGSHISVGLLFHKIKQLLQRLFIAVQSKFNNSSFKNGYCEKIVKLKQKKFKIRNVKIAETHTLIFV